MFLILRSILLIVLICFTPLLISQEFLKTEGQKIVNESGEEVLLKGMGLGGWMLQEGYMLQTASFANAQHKIRERIQELIGAEATDNFYDGWLKYHVTQADIDSLAVWGFNSVRLPMHYNLFTLPIEDEPIQGQHTWLEKGFSLIDSLISWCRPHELYIVLDLHAAPGGQGRDEGISDYDPNKPSLWESALNRAKTVALWERLASRYVDEPLIAGYDLINETNWPLENNNELLRSLYGTITETIRAVDKNHIIFIEGNWFANDFTGLTPPWDDNMVYSPHKYWSFNDQASIQWVLDIREQFDIPLYLGESGENSNVWFRDAIKLLDEHNIGWAWWPMKKIESIAGPLSVIKTDGYQTLLDYWNNGGIRPDSAFANDVLNELIELLKIENCIYQKDVIDAMFRQQVEETAIPFAHHEIPGIIHATDFDMGPIGIAYHDSEAANYQVSTGDFTAWNNGWSYRNDGIDIELSEDNINTNGYNVGWCESGEWMQYHINVLDDGLYDINIRVGANDNRGRFHFQMGNIDLTSVREVPTSQPAGWQSWQTVTLTNIPLTTTDRLLQFHIDNPGFNLGSFEFIKRGNLEDITTTFLSAFTIDANNIQLNLNKPMSGSISNASASFEIYVNDILIPITLLEFDEEDPRKVTFTIDRNLISTDDVRISYQGQDAQSVDGVLLAHFDKRIVQNRLTLVHAIPGKIEAEAFSFQQGIQLENTTDAGGGQNVGFLDVGDFLEYEVNVSSSGTFEVEYRTASESQGGGLSLQWVREDDTIEELHQINFQSTGGWQTWRTTSTSATLPEGQHTLRIVITESLFNINWINFSATTDVQEIELENELTIFPNPARETITIKGIMQTSSTLQWIILDNNGQILTIQKSPKQAEIKQSLNIGFLPSGSYNLLIMNEAGEQAVLQFIKLE